MQDGEGLEHYDKSVQNLWVTFSGKQYEYFQSLKIPLKCGGQERGHEDQHCPSSNRIQVSPLKRFTLNTPIDKKNTEYDSKRKNKNRRGKKTWKSVSQRKNQTGSSRQ